MKSLANWPRYLQPYRVHDRKVLEAIIGILCSERHWMHTTHFEPTPAWEHALAEPECPCHLLLVACDGEEPIGWCRAFPTERTGEAEIGIGLLPPYRNRGLGTRMLQRAIEWARKQGLERLVLTTRDDNHHAIHVFAKCGFTPTGRKDGRWIEMALPLSSTVIKERLP